MLANKSFTHAVTRCLFYSFLIGVVSSLLLVVIVLTLTAVSTNANAMPAVGQQHFQTVNETESGSLLFKSEAGLYRASLLNTEVTMQVTGMIASVTLKQSFQNLEDDWKEATYVFPLPEDAAVDHLLMHVGERIIEGQIKEKQQARQIYQQARREGKKASLIERQRPNIFTTNVANIGPKETIVIEIQYQHLLTFDAGTFSLRFPMVVAPRYIPGNTVIEGFAGTGWADNTDEVPDAKQITPPVLHPVAGKINPVSINIRLDAGFALEKLHSLYHPITMENTHKNIYEISLLEEDAPADRDFVLSWKPDADNTPRAAFFKEHWQGEDYALIMLLPPAPQQSNVLSRELVFVIDTSGSMSGQSILQAKAALELALTQLKPGDFFNIIQFNSVTSQLFSSAQAVSTTTLEQAHHYIRQLQANGGTEMASAIRAALMRSENMYDVRQVVFLTDGSVGNEHALFEMINQQLHDSRLFTIGIGSAPNAHFMNRAAQLGRGTHTYIGDVSEVQTKMGELFSKLASPVLSNISLQWPDAVMPESWPQKIPDLYLGQPLLITSKATVLPTTLSVSGKISDKAWRSTLSLTGGQEQTGIHALWARRKIAALQLQQTNPKEAETIRQDIIDTALKHHLVSQHTSLVAVDITPARPLNKPLKTHAQATNLPAGWEYEKVFGAMPQTATPAGMYFLIGLSLMLLSLFLRLNKKVNA